MTANRRILIVDDNPAIHDDFRKVLGGQDSHALLEASEAALFDEVGPATPVAEFELADANQGQEGAERVREALDEGRPFAVAFIDIRMPPGWDGVVTAARLWDIDPRLQVVICSAYSDYSWDQMREKLGPRSQLLILKKPFEAIEVLQLAHALTEKWELLQSSQMATAKLEAAVAARTESLELTHRKLAETKSRLADSKRLEGLGRLAGGLAHEINNPLSFITTNLRFIRDVVQELQHPVPISEDLGRAADDALVGAERIRRIVRDVKIFAKAEAAPLTHVDLGDVVERALALAQPEISDHGAVCVELKEKLSVVASEEGLVQVLYNLLVNATHALPVGRKPANQVRVRADRLDDGRVWIEVQDNGCGISQEDLSRIFEPFYSTQPVGSGTGLGLCICHGIVSYLGGEISVDSVVGEGTTFRVLLPAATEKLDTAFARPIPQPLESRR